MDTEAIQKAITAQLSGAFAGTNFTAEDLPETEDGYERAVPNPISYVLYTGSEPLGFLSTDPVVQRRLVKFNVECYSLLLYGSNGINAISQLVELYLIGFKPPNCERLYLVKDEIGKGDDSIWSHVYNLACETVLVQNNFSEPVLVPSLVSVTADEPDTNNDFSTDFG